MSVLATKFYIPPLRAKVVSRPHLTTRLRDGLHRRLTLVSAAAGFGKTTLVSEWLTTLNRRVAWLSLDEGDNDPKQFMIYFIAALQQIAPKTGEAVLLMLQAPQPPPPETILTALLNEIAAIPERFVLVLDDYHVIDAQPINGLLAFLLEYLPPQMHLVIATREDPQLPLARLRARDQLTELRITDLRFTPDEAADFLNVVMGLSLAPDAIAALETRTEGWIAGLQLAAISMQGHKDTAGFIRSFTGSHRFVLDYLVEEVLHQQPASVQNFLLRTAILDRLCGALCDAVLDDETISGHEMLAYVERANLFIMPLDNERRWYRYHHLFADLLRQRLQHPDDMAQPSAAELHMRASRWYESNGLEIEAFQHAAAAHALEDALRLIEGRGMPLPFRGVVAPVLNWLASLPTATLDSVPALWVWYASVLLAAGRHAPTEPTLQAAEAAIERSPPDDRTPDLIGRIAAVRATLAVSQHQSELIISQSRRALEYLHPDNLPFRTSTMWKLGYAYELQGERDSASQAYTEAIAIGQATGNVIFTVTALLGLGSIQHADNQLARAADTYKQSLALFKEMPLPVVGEAYLGLARIAYAWDDLTAARQYAEQGSQLARQLENMDREVAFRVFFAQLSLAENDVAGAEAILAQASQIAQQRQFVRQISNVAGMQVLTLLRQGNVAGAAQLAQTHALPLSQARVLLAEDNPAAVLDLLATLRASAEAKNWADERLQVLVLQAVAHYANGDKQQGLEALDEALRMAAPEGFIRIFVDEGERMAQLLVAAANRVSQPEYVAQLLAAFGAEMPPARGTIPDDQPLIEPLSERELEILRLIEQGLSNHDIAARLFLALNTVKGHNQRIFGKLQVERRTEAVARARQLGLL